MMLYSLIFFSLFLVSNSDKTKVGGTAKRKTYPFITFIGEITSDAEDFYKCAGVIVDDYWILTVAQCVTEELEDDNVYKIASDLFVTLDSEKANVSKIIVHPYYEPGDYVYDIAMVKLQEKIEMSKYFDIANISRPICGGNGPTDLFYKSCTLISKSGKNKYTPGVEKLVAAPVQLISIDKCLKIRKHKSLKDEICHKTNICTYNNKPDYQYPFACKYDFILGSPLYCGHRKYGDVVALLIQSKRNSFCKVKYNPEVYVKVAQHAEWIDKIIANN